MSLMRRSIGRSNGSFKFLPLAFAPNRGLRALDSPGSELVGQQLGLRDLSGGPRWRERYQQEVAETGYIAKDRTIPGLQTADSISGGV